MVTHTGEILYTAATDKNNAVLLKVVANAGDIGTDFNTVRKSYSGDLSERGVRLFGGSCLDSGANASLLGGEPFRSAGAFAFFSETSLPLRTNWLNVGMFFLLSNLVELINFASHSSLPSPIKGRSYRMLHDLLL